MVDTRINLVTGLTGSKGSPRQKGMKGDKEERNGGTMYVRWGHYQCSSTAQLAERPYVTHTDGESNPQCLVINTNFLTPVSGARNRGYVYGVNIKHILTVTVMFMEVKV